MARKKMEVKGNPKKATPAKKAASSKKVITKKPAAKAKLTPAASKNKTPARKPETRKRPIGFEMMKSFQNLIEKSFESLQAQFDELGVSLNEYVYEGKRKNAQISRQQLMNITKEAKVLRDTIQQAKVKLKPIYKK